MLTERELALAEAAENSDSESKRLDILVIYLMVRV